MNLLAQLFGREVPNNWYLYLLPLFFCLLISIVSLALRIKRDGFVATIVDMVVNGVALLLIAGGWVLGSLAKYGILPSGLMTVGYVVIGVGIFGWIGYVIIKRRR